jgi:ubiquinone/menaquinone biosynthesis C-methylase UbiE
MSSPFDDASIVAGYETWYATTGQRADRLEKALLRELFENFPKVKTILEVGCGTGHFTRWFKAQGLRATGLDLSSAMLLEAKQYGSQTYVRGDSHRLPFPNSSFDIVTFITTLEFLHEPMLVLMEANRVARQGLILGVINRIGWVGKQYRQQGGMLWDSAQFYTPKELIKMVKQTCGEDDEILWKTTLWRWHPWTLPLPWGGFIGMGVRKE